MVTVNDVLKLVRDSGVETLDERVDPSLSLLDQGLDSLDMMNVYFQIEEQYGVIVDEDSIGNGVWNSLEGIASSLNKQAG